MLGQDFIIDFIKTIAPYAKWVLIIFVVVHIFCLIDKKRNGKLPDIRTRMFRKFQYVNSELFGHLDSQEKKDMLDVLKTTLSNAELFSTKESRTHITDSGRKKSAKKVRFNPSMVSDTFVY
jgi:hypothetical protein